MKRTELERRERELRRTEKKVTVLERKMGGEKATPGAYIDSLFGLLRYDTEEIFNTQDDVNILELLENMKANLPEKQWENVLRKAIKKTNVVQKDRAFDEIKTLLS